MSAQSPSASAPSVLPSRINWICCKGVVLHYERMTAAELIASGLLLPDEIPQRRAKKSRGGRMRVHATNAGTYNVSIDAEELLVRDLAFKRFLGGVLADTRLSLVKGESDV